MTRPLHLEAPLALPEPDRLDGDADESRCLACEDYIDGGLHAFEYAAPFIGRLLRYSAVLWGSIYVRVRCFGTRSGDVVEMNSKA